MEDKKITIDADHIEITGKTISITATAGDTVIKGGPLVKINP
jgi:hypothetical protein